MLPRAPLPARSPEEERAAVAGAAAGPYCILRTFSRTLRLSPFTLEALVAAVLHPAPTPLIDDAHVALLRLILGDRPVQAALSQEAGQGHNVHILPRWEQMLDHVTWPEYARLLIEDRGVWRGSAAPRHVASLLRRSEYYRLPPADKVAVLAFLADEILQTSAIRTELKCREGMEDELLEEAECDGPWRVGQSVEARAPDHTTQAPPSPACAISPACLLQERFSSPSDRLAPATSIFSLSQIRGVEAGLRGSWFAGSVVAVSKKHVRVRFFDLLTEDGAGPLQPRSPRAPPPPSVTLFPSAP